MAQVFPPAANAFARLSLVGTFVGLFLLLCILMELDRTPWVTNARIARQQPVPFSHKHHVGDDGIDCRYCHTAVEQSRFAGIPPTQTCMNCHSVLYANSPMLEPVRESYRTGQAILWTRVHDLPDYVYFNHSMHVGKGIGCSTCHGRVDRMPAILQIASLRMEWCLGCHRDPKKYLRPQEDIYRMDWLPGPRQDEQGSRLLQTYGTPSVNRLTDCDTCHR